MAWYEILGIVIAVLAFAFLIFRFVVRRAIPLLGFLVLVVVIFIASLVAAGVFDSGTAAARSPNTTVTAPQKQKTVTPVALGPQVPRSNCFDDFNVVVEPHAGNKVSSVQTTGNPTTWPAQVMQIAKHDPAVLQLYWNKTPAGQKNPITNARQLVGVPGTPDYGCYTQHGRDIWNQTDGAYENATIKAGQAPPVGVNTGVNATNDTPFQETPGPISGDRTAAQITFQNGAVIWEMKRCKNIVTTSPIPGISVMPSPSAMTPTTPGATPQTCASESAGKDVVVGVFPNCTKHCVSATACGPNGQNSPGVQSNPSRFVQPTPNYPPGQAETVTGAQTPPPNPYKPNPKYGSNPPPGQQAPAGGDNGKGTGGHAGVGSPSGSPNPGGGVAQPPSTTIVTSPTGTTVITTGGNPCADPNAKTCTAG